MDVEDKDSAEKNGNEEPIQLCSADQESNVSRLANLSFFKRFGSTQRYFVNCTPAGCPIFLQTLMSVNVR